MSLLSLLAEVASEKLKNDPVVNRMRKLEHKTVRNHEGKTVTLLQASSMSENSLIRHFSINQSDEIKRKFYYTCCMVPFCKQLTESFGSEQKARNEMKKHLQRHLRNLLQANNSVTSQENYFLQAIEKQKLRPSYDSISKKRTSKNELKSFSILNGKENSVTQPLTTQPLAEKSKIFDTSEREKLQMLKIIRPNTSNREPVQIHVPLNLDSKAALNDTASFRTDSTLQMKRNDDMDIDEGAEFESKYSPIQSVTLRQCGEVVSHDHAGYVGTFKEESTLGNHRKEIKLEPKDECLHEKEFFFNEEAASLTDLRTPEEDPLYQHMTREINVEMMACGAFSEDTPLPLVGSEVEFRPEDQPPESEERRIWKQTKGKGKFIGQSKVEKEMALQLIEEMKLQPVLQHEDLQCRICKPSRSFTAHSTLLSHYKSHAGIRPYICTLCESVFTRQHSLNYHMLIHTNQTRFTCDDCGRKFRHPSHFKEHRRRHTGESPYECLDCSSRFKTRNTYKRHLRTRHLKLLTTQGDVISLTGAAEQQQQLSTLCRNTNKFQSETGIAELRNKPGITGTQTKLGTAGFQTKPGIMGIPTISGITEIQNKTGIMEFRTKSGIPEVKEKAYHETAISYIDANCQNVHNNDQRAGHSSLRVAAVPKTPDAIGPIEAPHNDQRAGHSSLRVVAVPKTPGAIMVDAPHNDQRAGHSSIRVESPHIGTNPISADECQIEHKTHVIKVEENTDNIGFLSLYLASNMDNGVARDLPTRLSESTSCTNSDNITDVSDSAELSNCSLKVDTWDDLMKEVFSLSSAVNGKNTAAVPSTTYSSNRKFQP